MKVAIFSAILAVVASYPRLDRLNRGNGNNAYRGRYTEQMNFIHPSNNYMGGPATRTGQGYPADPFNYDSRDGHEGPVDPSGFTDHTGLSEYPGNYSSPNHEGSVEHVNYGYHDGLEHHEGPADHSGPADYADPADHAGPAGYTDPPDYDHPPGYKDPDTWNMSHEGPSDYNHPTNNTDIRLYMNHEGPPDFAAPPSHDDSQFGTGAYVGPKVKTWTAMELFDAINANSDDESMPYIKDAANQILLALFTNHNWKNVLAAIPSPSGQNTWKLQELEQYSEIPATGEEFRASLDHAHHLFIDLQQSYPHIHIQSIPVVIAAVDISTWNMEELTQALQDPNTNPDLKTRVQKALHELQIRATSDRDKISIVTRVGLIDNNPEYYELYIPPELLPLLKGKAMYAFD